MLDDVPALDQARFKHLVLCKPQRTDINVISCVIFSLDPVIELVCQSEEVFLLSALRKAIEKAKAGETPHTEEL